MQNNILIVHGWLHSSSKYAKLKESLCRYNKVDLFEFPGFGNTKHVGNIFTPFKLYEKLLMSTLNKGRYHTIFGHSMGGVIILRILNKLEYAPRKVILSNVPYLGISKLKLLSLIIPVNIGLLGLIKVLPTCISKTVIKLFSTLTINNSNLFDDLMFLDVKRCNPIAASITLFLLAFNKIRF